MPSADPFYPSLANILPLEAIPPNLGFIQGALQAVFDHLYYRDLQVHKSKLGDVGYYQLSLVIPNRLGLEIPGTGGAALVFDPGQTSPPTTEIPIALSYRWDILKYIKDFDPSSTADLPRLLFDALIEISGAEPPDLLTQFISFFHGGEADPLQAFVDAFNLDRFPATPLSKLSDPDPAVVLANLLTQLNQVQQINIPDLMFAAFQNLATSLEDVLGQISSFFENWVRGLSIDDFAAFLLPHCSLSIKELNLALEFPRSLLKPVDANGNVIDETSTLPEDKRKKSRLTFKAGSLSYSTDTGFEFDALGQFAFDRSQIADTGITLYFTGMKLDLSRTKNIPEATADGRPVDFVGVYVQQADIGLPRQWFNTSSSATAADPTIIGSNIIIGTGGLSGKIGFDAAGVLHKKLGNFDAALNAFDLTFERNALIESNIAGTLTIPGFKDAAGADATIAIKAHIAEDGDFSVTATEPNGIVVHIPGVMDFKIYSLGFGRADHRFFLATSGNVTLTFQIPGLTFDRPIAADIKKLTIWEDGRLEIEGGTIILPQALTLKVGPVKLSVTALGMGSYERNGHPYRWISFDGGVNVNPGGVDVRASGVKVYWRTDAASIADLDIFVQVDGIAIDLVLPGGKSADEAAVLIGGFLQVKQPDPAITGSTAGTEYAGGVSVKLPKLGMGISAAMRLNPSIPAFVIDAELSLSVPIPIPSTNLGIYAFRLLIGMRYVVDRAYPPLGLAADADWYEYYKKKVPLLYKEGLNIDKLAQHKGFAIGAGVTAGTANDSGKAFSAKLFLLLSLPDVILLQGQAAIMSERVDLSPNDPPFTALIAITRQSVEAAFGANYKLPEDTGAILDVQALIEMGFFFHDSSAWYINVGRDQPESKRVTARVLSLFNGWTFLMLSASGIRAGAGISWGFDKGFGPVSLTARVYLDAQGHISFKPKELGGAIMLGGGVAIRVFKFKFGLSVAAVLAAEAPKPFIVTGSVAVHLELPRPFRKLGGTFTVNFTWTFDSHLDTQAVAMFNDADVGEAVKAVSLVTRERFAVNVPAGSAYGASALPPPPASGWSGSFDDFVIPPDAAVDIEFKKPVAAGPAVTNIGITGAGCKNIELVPPQRGKSPQVQHCYVVEEVKIRSWNPTTNRWNDYDVYGALTPLAHTSFVNPASLIGLKQGWWQRDQSDKVNKLSLLAQTPFHYANDVAGPFVPENSGVTAETIFCPQTPIAEQCVVIDDIAGLTTLTADQRYAWKDVQARVSGKDGQVTPFLNPFALTNGLALKPESQLEIFFPETTGHIRLRLGTLADDITLLYQRRRQTGTDSSHQPVYGYVTVRRDVLDAVKLLKPVTYEAIDEPIDKLVIVAGRCTCAEGLTAMTATAVAAPAQWPPAQPGAVPAVMPPPAPPPCGSLAAYLANVCAAASAQLDSLQHQYAQLLAQANEYEQLAQHAAGNPCCDPTLPTRYHQIAQELLDAAAALQSEIASLTAFVGCCSKLRSTPGAAPAAVAIPVGGGPPRFDCNIDPKFDYGCMSLVFGICWLPLRDQIFNGTIPGFSTLLANNNAMASAINNTIYPVWRPDTIYAVSIRTVDNVNVFEKGFSDATPKYLHFGFRTRGPVGHFHPYRAEYQALKAEDRGDQYRLQSLKPYIDFARSYPAADGNLLGAKPLFYRNPKLRLFYTQPYVYTMYGGHFDAYNGNPAVTSTLEVSILDPVDPLPSGPTAPGYVLPVSHAFAAHEVGHSNLDVQLLSNMATQGASCTGVGHDDGIAPMGIQSIVAVDQLKPLKLYLAVYKANYNGDKQIVHTCNFQTSRYGDFAEQVNSYRLTDRNGGFAREAVFDDIAVTLDATRAGQLAALLAGNYPSGDPLEQEYADPFDRLMDGILQVDPLDPPVGTDFTVVRDRSTTNVIGILVRNPEPFNDPKIPSALIDATIALAQQNAPPKTFTVIHSKDRAKAFVGDPSLNLALHDLTFTFTYLEYDGAAYAPATTVVVNLFPSPPLVPTLDESSAAAPAMKLPAGSVA